MMIQEPPSDFFLGPAAFALNQYQYNYGAYGVMPYEYDQMPNYNQQSLRHHRSNSDNWIEHTTSVFDALDSHIEYLLPKSLLKEFDVDLQKNNSPSSSDSLNKFESVLSEQGTEAGKTFITNLVSTIADSKEQGKTLRNAAEMAKRLSEVPLSLEFYAMSTKFDPATPASWIDRAKLLDELGDYEKADSVLQEGIFKVQHCEQLIRKLLKLFERVNKLDYARTYLGSLVNNKMIDRETVLVEGALFELRQGHVEEAMAILKSVKGQNGWKPNIYSELVQYFERSGLIMNAFDIVEEGAKLNPRNAIICQSLLKNQKEPATAINILKESSRKWTNEFTDKMTTIVCESLAANGYLGIMRNLLSEASTMCSPKQRYKLFFTASTIELTYGDPSLSPLLLDKTLSLTPFKAKPMVLILLAKVYELNQEFDQAQQLFEKTAIEFSAEWRVFLELAQFHVHRNNIQKAIEVLNDALKMHNGSGRLWAFRVQLEAFNSVESQIQVLKNAIQAVPKSGEVWCEAARIALNPQTEYFSIQSAKKFLEFAYRFTPQHGDSLVEMLRVEMLEKGFNIDYSEIQKKFICSEGNYGLLFIYIRKLMDRPLTEVFDDAVREVKEDISRNSKVYARAIARSSFVVRSILEEEDRLRQSKASEPSSKFAFGLTNVGEMMRNPSICATPEQLLAIVLGTSASGQ
ncbi:hypothetical protein TRFO_36799 [Tritrichomonas foetus]|uniref:TPR Domain containing protein n=1 Tax=Tritrichomonas foetus TaxID=1144522 RepID=A0A1J4JEE2_9EUKA|nr:hypothetical protein TRFO_36799 [Tritrichomonas foetus]|eukprot:OHS97025.1 hypothetical protein TRFO_36799 [Tritrichomonas foetus]